MTGFTYPTGLYDLVRRKWNIKRCKEDVVPALPDKEIFQNMIDTVYHASFLTEESRRIWFRVVYISPKEIGEKDKIRLRYVNTIEFDKPRMFTVNELLKLAPAADPTQVLIGVYKRGKSKELEIWGLIEAGTSWWDFTRHESSGGSPPPNAFTLSSKKPGQISISRQGDLLLILDQGRIAESSSSVFYEGHVADFLEKGAQELYKAVCKMIKDKSWDPEGEEDDYPKRAYIYFLERILNRVREKFHGGTLIMVPDEISVNDTRLTDRIIIKYPCHYDSAWESLIYELMKYRHYFDLYFKLWDNKQITQDEFQQCSIENMNLEEAEERVKYAAGFLASLSAVDGAVVITNKLHLLGFGAEIIATSPSLNKIKIITDFEKDIGEYIDIELFGTRHRSAFRFCSSFEDSVAFIVSQDGEIRIAKRVDSEVMLWSNINVGSLGF
jgi:hypothetical protein